MSDPVEPGPSVLWLRVEDRSALHAAYMPFIRGGGIFFPTTESYALGSEVFLLLQLPDEAEQLPLAGKVVWTTPERSGGRRVRGIGVQFSDSEGPAKARIENLLAGQLHGESASCTL